MPLPAARRRYLERAVDRMLGELERIEHADRTASGSGLLQRLDPRVKVIGLIALTLAATFVTSPWTVAALLVFATLLGWASGLPPQVLATRVWLGVFLFTGTIAAPALFLTPGDVAWRVPFAGWGVTAQGARSAVLLLLRVETTATLAFVLVTTTAWTRLLKALRVLQVPVVLVVVLGMTARYAILLLQAAHDMFDARRSRGAGVLPSAARRRVPASAAGVLFDRTLQLGADVHLAMQARGFRGEVRVLDERRMHGRDWIALAGFVVVAAAAAWTGR
jgi:cobalt ECF transporter T component CbiQ